MPFDPQVYRLASIARDKLCREAAKASHDLRALVAHANILDELLTELNAPGGGSTEHYGFDLLPEKHHTEREASRPVDVIVKEKGDHELGREHSTHSSSDSTPLRLPLLSHDSDSDSDSDSGSDSDESDDSDDFETIMTAASRTESSNTSMSSVDEEHVEPDESDLGLHRTKSIWRLLGSMTASSGGQEKVKGKNPIDIVTDARIKMSA